MGRRYITSIFFLLFLMGFVRLSAQEKYDYHTDTLTYSLYMEGDWEALFDSARLAEKHNISFYYLELRGAFAAFNTQRYERALQKFDVAESYQKGDAVVAEYHYLSALYAGHRLAQIERYEYLSEEAKSRYKDPKRNVVEMLAIESGYNHNSDFKTLQDTEVHEGTDIYGERILLKNLSYNSLKLSHGVLPYLTLNHSFQLINLNKVQDFYALESDITNPIVESYPISTQQYQYHADAIVNIMDKLHVSPSFTYVRYNARYFKSKYEDDETYSFNEHTEKRSQFLYGLTLNYMMSRLHVSAHSNYFTGDHFERWQAGLGAKYFLKRDKTQYLSGTFDLLSNKQSNSNSVWSLHYGFKAHKYWFEVNHTAGDLRNYTEGKGEIVYNTYEKVLSRSGVSISRPIFNDSLWLSVYYRYINYSSFYVYLDENIVLKKRDFAHNNHSITGGLSWYF